MSCLLGCLLRCVEEDCQHCNGKDDADGVSNGGIVSHQLAVCLGVDHLAQALGSQHEVGAGHSAHEGCRHGGDPEVLLTEIWSRQFLMPWKQRASW